MNKEFILHIRVTEEQKKHITDLANKYCISVSDYLRMIIFSNKEISITNRKEN